MSSDNVQALTPGTRLGDYRLDAVIGHGGFGITYRSFDTQLAKFVAIKEYLPVEFAVRGGDGNVVPRGARFAEDFAWGRERFLDEARALARFRHLHIVPVLRYFEAAPIEQYALDGKQGPWSDIYSAAAVLHHAIAGLPPPDAAGRVGTDPYRPLATTHADRFEPAFLGAIDRALAFAPTDRPQTVEEWAALFGPSIARVADAPTQRLGGVAGAMPRLGGARRDVDQPETPTSAPPRRPRRRRMRLGVVILLIVLAGLAVERRFKPELQALISGPPRPVEVAQQAPSPAPTPQPSQATPTPPVTRPVPAPAPAPDTSKQALIDQAGRATVPARAVLERADEAARAARAMAGEARIVAARAARPDLQNAERLSNDGVSYVGQTSDGKRQGLGVAELGNGERQAGDFQDGRLNGLGTVRLEDDTRYAGQWRDGQASGLGAREKPGVDRAEGNFVAGRLEGLGVRRTLTEPVTVQSGEFRADLLEGPGVEIVGDQRYEGGFRGGKRNGYGQVTSADGKVQSGRWEDGKPIETTP